MMTSTDLRGRENSGSLQPGRQYQGKSRRRRFGTELVLFSILLLTNQLAAQPLAETGAVDQSGPCAEGERLFRERLYKQAEPLLKQCAELEAPPAQTFVYLTVVTVMDRRPQEGRRWGQKAVAANPESAAAHYWYGRAQLEGGDAEAAVKQWEIGLQKDANHAGLLEGMARVALDKGEDAKAYNLLNQLQRTGVEEGWIHALLSELARRKGQWPLALQHWQRKVDLEGEDGASLLVSGELSILAGDTASAVVHCRRAVELDPSAASYGGLGEALFAADRHAEALEALRKAVALDGDQPRFRFNLANVLEILGLYDEAENQFRRYVELAPQDAIGRFNYGIHLDKQGKTEAALTQVDAALTINASLLSARVVRAQLLEKLGRFEDALAVIDTLMERDSENIDQLQSWRQRVLADMTEAQQEQQAGKVQLLHIMTPDSHAVPLIMADLDRGVDFAELATKYSHGPTAAQGGGIGWVAPEDMIEPLRSAIADLKPNQVSQLIESNGLYHFFKRVR